MKPKVVRRRKKDAPAELVPCVGDDGTVEWVCPETGVTADKLEPPGWRPYNERDASIFMQCVSLGMTVADSLSKIDLSRSAYHKWRRDNPSFVAAVERARAERSETVFESLREETLSAPLSAESADPSDLDPEQLQEYTARNKARESALKVMERKVNVVNSLLAKDSPRRYGTKLQSVEHTGHTGVSITASITPEMRKLLESFRPSVREDGALRINPAPLAPPDPP